MKTKEKTNKKIAVFSLIKFYPLNTGGKVASFNIINKLAEKYDVDVFYFEERLSKKGLKPKINFKFIKLRESLLNKILPFVRHFHILDIFLTLLFFKKHKKKYDLIILDFPYLFFIAKIISLIYKIPLYLIEYNLEYEYYRQRKNPFWFFLKLFEYFVIKNVNKTFFISYEEYLKTKNKFNNIFYLQLPLNHFNYQIYWSNIKNHKNLNVCFYGKLDEIQNKKALFTFIQIFKKLKSSQISFFVFGSSTKKVNKIPKEINYLGFVENPFDILKKMDIILIPIEHSSGVKIRIMESLFIGKIVITSSKGKKGIPLELKPFVFEANNFKEILNILFYFFKNKKEIYHLKNKLIKAVRDYNKFSNKNIFEKIK